jgi:Type VI secretion system (T6SS), amidase immunity protein
VIRARIQFAVLGFASMASMPSMAQTNQQSVATPEAGSRTYAQNYKDMVLATCIATAYRNDRKPSIDAGSSVSALRDWTVYDLEKAPSEIGSLVHAYLARNYRNPVAEAEAPGIRFDLLKCLDLYHSRELDAQTRDLVIDPTHTYRQGSHE